jgi:alpha-1,2-mannosyltransferase
MLRTTDWRGLALLVPALVLALLLLGHMPGGDYLHYVQAARAWGAGASQLYDPAAPQFFYLPWAMLLIGPLSLLPDAPGLALFNGLSVVGVVAAVAVLGGERRRLPVVLSVSAAPVMTLLLLGQWDGIILGGVALGWWAVERRRPWLLGLALVIMSTKATNIGLALLVVLWPLRSWSLRALLRVAVLPVVAGLASVLMLGWWPVRYLAFLHATPPGGYNTAILALPIGLLGRVLLVLLVLGLLGRELWRHGATARTLTTALLASLLLSPYVVFYHAVTLTPALARLRGRVVPLVAWLLGVVAFLGVVWRGPVVVPALYPLLVLVVSMAPDRVKISSNAVFSRESSLV